MKCLIIGGVDNKHITDAKKELFQNQCIRIGEFLCEKGHSLIVCSPFKDSADYWVLNGFLRGKLKKNQIVEIHFIDDDVIYAEINQLEIELGFKKFVKVPHIKMSTDDTKPSSYSWLLCQLEALEVCHFIFAIGGKKDGAANMLLLLAESKRKVVVPLTFFGGAAYQAFNRRIYELEDKLGNDYLLLRNESNILDSDNLQKLLSGFQISKDFTKKDELSFFISYSRAKPNEADYIENLLRRRNLKVFRDESDFGAGSSIPLKITEAIHSSNVFIATWCAEYACSPWCFDEFELALDRYEAGKMELLIFCTDGTRMVPKRARNLKYVMMSSREQIECAVLNLLERKL